MLVETFVSHGSEPGQLGLFDCETGIPEFGSNGLAVFAPDTPKAINPYQVSPVSVVVKEITSEVNGLEAIAYHSWTNCPPPMPSWVVLGENVNPAESLTENAVPTGKQSHPTMMTSGPLEVVRATEQEVT